MQKEEVVQMKSDEVQIGMVEIVKTKLGEAFDEGVLSGKAESGGLSQADVDKMIADAKKPLEDKIAELEAKPDLTPYSQEDVDMKVGAAVDEATAPLKAQLASLSMSAEDREKMEESIADQMATLADAVRKLTVLAPTPVPVPETPVEEPAPVDGAPV